VLPPAPQARLNDYAGVLGPADRQRIEDVLAAHERATGAQMAIAVFPSLEGESLEDVSIRLAEQWKIGHKGSDNGIILVVFVQDRKLRFEVGYGLEPVVPDIEAGRIIREVIAPRFREGRYAAGLEDAVNAVYARIEKGPQPARGRGRGGPGLGALAFLAILGIIAFMLGREAMGSRRFVRRNGYTMSRRGWSTPVITGGGWGGGGWRSGGGGGGFSGGGGSFGGGGASGNW
jgi:uncharacterized protein